MRREAGHPVRTEMRIQLVSIYVVGSPKPTEYLHGRHDNGGDYSQRDDVKDETDEQPSRWTIIRKQKKTR